MSLDLKQCNQICHECVKGYIKKYNLKQGDRFAISCNGIPKVYIPDHLLATLDQDPEFATAMISPAHWASKFLDWHCIDPDGEIWKRKTFDGTLPAESRPYDAAMAAAGQSIFNRPYQFAMLSCTSKKKVFRIGRQSGKTECLCIVILYSLFTKSNFKVVLVTPYQSQIDMIFSRLTEMITSNTLLQNSIARNAKAPNFQIKLHNGSYINGFTAGTRSGQEAGAARGQPANMLVFDEADYLVPGDIQATLATITNFPNATVWMSSTPTGRREKFYETCNSKLYKEFHFSSRVNPNWSKELEEFFREEYTEDQYNHEINAEFGEQEEGVYKAKYIEVAKSNYEYDQMAPQPGWLYAIGVDWNDVKIGTTITVVGYNPLDGIFYLVDKHIVVASEWTQLGACEKVAEYNRIWNPFAIYVDSGFGATQVEVLQKFGYDSIQTKGPTHPDAKLRYLVKAFAFGGTIETYDPFTKIEIRKPAKPFLVENSVRRFETSTFKFPSSDKKYIDSLHGYIVDRITDAGRPVYKAQNEAAGDHIIDSVNLALLAFTLEKTEFGQPKYQAKIAFTGPLKVDELDPSRFNKEVGTLRSVANEYRPSNQRSNISGKEENLIINTEQNIPINNSVLQKESIMVKLWDWPGWGYDRPAPSVKQRSSLPTKHRPRRTKF